MQEAFKFIKRHRILTREHYWFEIDEYLRADGAQFLLAHLRFNKWTPAIRKSVERDWTAFRQVVTVPLFATGEVDDPKFDRFAKSFGWRVFDTVTCENGEQRRLFIHTV